VPVSTKQPLGVDQEQIIEEEEEDFFCSWRRQVVFSPCIFYFVLYNWIIIKLTFIMILH
jgi:hypothetical protein